MKLKLGHFISIRWRRIPIKSNHLDFYNVWNVQVEHFKLFKLNGPENRLPVKPILTIALGPVPG